MFKTCISEGNSCFAIVDFPEPAGPAKNIALGLDFSFSMASLKRDISLIIANFVINI
jgi:hypothetical protein